MTIRQILRYFATDENDAAPVLAVYRSPGMHQVFDDPNELALTPEDRELLNKLGIGSDPQ